MSRLRRPTTKLKPILIVAPAILWLSLAGIVYFLPPQGVPTFITFFTFLSLALFSTLQIISKNPRRAFLFTFAVTTWLILRILGLGTLLNAILIGVLTLAIELTLKPHST